MIFEELVAEVCERLNLTSDEAKSRVGRALNNRYRRITSSIGLDTTRRVEVSSRADIGERTFTFEDIEKLLSVIDRSSGSDVVLAEVSADEINLLPVRSEPPRNYAVIRNHANTVDIYLDCEPTTEFTLYAKGFENLSTLSGSMEPDFPESFHDTLIFGAIADEYRKMEKVQLARDSETDYERRLSDLRMWIAKSAYMDIVQGKQTNRNFKWMQDPRYAWPW